MALVANRLEGPALTSVVYEDVEKLHNATKPRAPYHVSCLSFACISSPGSYTRGGGILRDYCEKFTFPPRCNVRSPSSKFQCPNGIFSWEMYRASYGSLTKAIKKKFSGHERDALLHIVSGVKTKRSSHPYAKAHHRDPSVWRDMKYIHAAMKGLGTKDDRLIARYVLELPGRRRP